MELSAKWESKRRGTEERIAFLPCKSREPEVAGVGELERSGMLTYLSVLAGKRRGVPVPGPGGKWAGEGFVARVAGAGGRECEEIPV